MAGDGEMAEFRKTPNGIPYKMLWPTGYQEAWTREGNHIVALLKVEGPNTIDFLREVVGYTEWNTGTKLTRHLPMLCPYSNWHYLVSADLVKKGMRPNPLRTTNASEFYEGWWDFESDDAWLVYQCVFRRPRTTRFLLMTRSRPGTRRRTATA